MDDVRFIVWHTPRSGSNMLMSMLSQTGVAGIADYINCGFFIGFPNQWNNNQNFESKCLEYFNKQRTPNGVTGTKAGMSYFDDFRPVVGNYKVDKLLKSFTHHIFLRRRDKIAQAVSRLIAGATKIWSTIQVDEGVKQFSEPVYSKEAIDTLLETIDNENQAIKDFFIRFELPFIPVYYEDVCENPEREVNEIIHSLGIMDNFTFKEPIIRKQVDSRKKST